MKNEINYSTEYKDYSTHSAIMISTDRKIFDEKSAVHARMIEQSKLYKRLYIVIFSTEQLSPLEIGENLIIYSTGSYSRLFYVFDAYRHVRNILNTYPQEHFLLSCQDPFETGLVGAYSASHYKNVELLLQIHTDLYSPYFTRRSLLNSIRLYISDLTLPHADVIRVVSKKIADSLVLRGYEQHKIILKPIHVPVRPTTISSSNLDLRKKFPKFKKIVLIMSRLESEKGIDVALRAFSLVSQKIDGLGLVIVGTGRKMNSLKSLARKLEISHKVAFEGWQNDTGVYYQSSDVLLVTSWYEGYGMVFKEASSYNLPIVSTDVGIARDVGARIVRHDVSSIARGLLATLS